MKNILFLLLCLPILAQTNPPDSIANLALSQDAKVLGSVVGGRGLPADILYSLEKNNYNQVTPFNEYGINLNARINTPFVWQVEWTEPKFVNYITFGGTYPNQPQPNVNWKISYLNDVWITIDEGVGGWIDSGIYEKLLDKKIIAKSIKVEIFSNKPIVSIHLRGRGGNSRSYPTDAKTTPKATLIQYLPSDEIEVPTSENLYRIEALESDVIQLQEQIYSQDIRLRVLTQQYETLSRRNAKDLTDILSNMTADFQLIGECSSLVQTYVVFGDINTNGFNLTIGAHKLIVHGKVNGKINKTCESSEIIEK